MAFESTPRGAFPPTLWSCILRDREGDAAARRALLERLCTAYWEPVFCQARFGWRLSVDDAADATQAFFTDLLGREFLDALDPAKGSLRSFLKAAFANFLRNRKRDAAREKRGGGKAPIALEDAARVADPGGDAEEAFDRAWLRLVLARTLETLRTRLSDDGRAADWDAFEAYDLAEERTTYAQVAEALGTTTADVRHALSRARALLRELVLAAVAEYVGDEDEAHEEVRWILG
jgi:RNA polymerase sigma factor (sigma-70 family)